MPIPVSEIVLVGHIACADSPAPDFVGHLETTIVGSASEMLDCADLVARNPLP
jgi:hypothetical protein